MSNWIKGVIKVINVEFGKGLYTGSFEEGLPQGNGIYTLVGRVDDKERKYVYQGEWRNGKKSGHGVEEVYENGKKYSDYRGGFFDNRRNGKGNLTFYENGGIDYIFDGDFLEGKIHGIGEIIFYDNGIQFQKYIGAWKEGKKHGQGVEYQLNGDAILSKRNVVYSNGVELSASSPNRNLSDNSQIDRYTPKYRTQDGHFVRSRAEVMIANWLYMNSIRFEYEKRLPIPENVLTDFYLIDTDTYIEHWGLENDEAYSQRKHQKIEIYKRYGLKLISLSSDDIFDLDTSLTALLSR